MPPFTHHAQGRSRTTALVLLASWAGLLGLWLGLGAAGWIVLALGAFTLPALADLIRNPTAHLRLDDTTLRWSSGRRQLRLRLAEIDHIRLDTRLDLSVRATAVLVSGARLRLPFECTPPHHAFEAALTARGVAVKRFHFQLLQ